MKINDVNSNEEVLYNKFSNCNKVIHNTFDKIYDKNVLFEQSKKHKIKFENYSNIKKQYNRNNEEYFFNINYLKKEDEKELLKEGKILKYMEVTASKRATIRVREGLVKNTKNIEKQSEYLKEYDEDVKKMVNDLVKTGISQEDKIYFIKNDQPFNYKNFLLSKGSGTKVNYEYDKNDFELLFNSFENLTDSSFEENEEIIKLFMANDIDITEKNINYYKHLSEIDLSEAFSDFAIGKVIGNNLEEVVISNSLKRYNSIKEVLYNFECKIFDVENTKVSINNLKNDNDIELNLENVKNINYLRLNLTLPLVYKMYSKNIKIENMDISLLKNELDKQLEVEYSNFVYENNIIDNKELFIDTQKVINDIKITPVEAYIGKNIDFNLRSLKNNSIKYFSSISKMNNYLMTMPRADMGDNIFKFNDEFEKVLKNNNLDINELNLKSVKALVNAKEVIDKNKIIELSEKIQKVDELLEKLTPNRVVDIIKSGFNPMDIDFSTLMNILEERFEEYTKEYDYATFLAKLNDNILTASEKEIYIGVYRLFNNIQLLENKPIVDIINSNKNLTIRNLVNMLNIKNNQNIDFEINDEIKLSRLVYKRKSIKEQLKGLDRNIVDDVLVRLSNKKYDDLLEVSVGDILKNEANIVDISLDIEDVNKIINKDSNLKIVDEINNLNFEENKLFFEKIKKNNKFNYEKIVDKFNKVLFEFSKETLDNIYDDLENDIDFILNKDMENNLDILEIRNNIEINDDFIYMKKISLEDKYIFPLKIDDKISMVNFSIKKDNGRKNIDINLNLNNMSNVKTYIEFSGNSMNCVFFSNKNDIEYIKINNKFLEEKLMEFKFDNINFEEKLLSDTFDIKNSTSNIDLKDMYKISGIIINYLVDLDNNIRS